MFERLTKPAIMVIIFSRVEARRLGHNRVGTEHILLGLIREKKSIAAQVLALKGVQLANARREVEKIIGRGAGEIAQEIPFTENAKSLLRSAWTEAHQLQHTHIDTEDLLFAISRMDTSVAQQVLKNLNVDVSTLPTQTLSAIAAAGAGKTPYGNRNRLRLTIAIAFSILTILAVLARVANWL